MVLDAKEYDTRQLNEKIRAAGEDCLINDCLGQRFIGSGLDGIDITINGIPGNGLGAYLNGANILVKGNVQDAVGDTMNAGRIVIQGNAGDALGYAMRGGEIYVRGNAGYRAGIHMKAYLDKFPVMVIGGACGSFLGEYQAGGLIIVLGLGCKIPAVGFFPGTGMHGGKIFFRGDYGDMKVPGQVTLAPACDSDIEMIAGYVEEYARLFDCEAKEILNEQFYVMTPNSKNPYKQLYVQN